VFYVVDVVSTDGGDFRERDSEVGITTMELFFPAKDLFFSPDRLFASEIFESKRC
jgi:hypothetical protein